jgi:O-acetyl-ADP-ribose deacetylase (regulator of RNase III)
MTKINYVIGDATAPQGDGKKLIRHVCNNVGAWGAGFVLALSKKWKQPEKTYLAMKQHILGTIDLVKVEEDIAVCNLIGQESTAGRNRTLGALPPVRYVAIEHALKEVAHDYELAKSVNLDFSVHMPRLGSGLAGGNWKIIETIIEETLCKAGIEVTVYDLPA